MSEYLAQRSYAFEFVINHLANGDAEERRVTARRQSQAWLSTLVLAALRGPRWED